MRKLSGDIPKTLTGHAMTISKRYTPTIPKGYQIYEGQIEPAGGWKYHKPALIKFVKSKRHELFLEHDASNKNDENAIKITSSEGLVLGFLPREIAGRIAASGTWGVIQPRIRNVYMGDNAYVVVEFDLVGPKDQIKRYRSAEYVPRAASPQRKTGRAKRQAERKANSLVILGCAFCGFIGFGVLLIIIAILSA